MGSDFGRELAAAEATFVFILLILAALLGFGLAYLIPFIFHHLVIKIV